MKYNAPLRVVRSHPWLTNVNPLPHAATRMVMFPHAGAGAAAYYSWAREIAGVTDVFIVQLPGREARSGEPLVRTVSAAIAGVTQGLLHLGDRRPTLFFGHSLGALLAYETCSAVEFENLLTPLSLVVSGRAPPHVPRRRAPIYPLPQQEFVSKIAQLGGITEEFLNTAELLEYVLPVLRADMEMNDTFVARPVVPLATPVVALSGRDDRHFPPEDIEHWRDTAKSCDVHYFDGGHFFLEQHRATIVQLIKNLISASDKTRASA